MVCVHCGHTKTSPCTARTGRPLSLEPWPQLRPKFTGTVRPSHAGSYATALAGERGPFLGTWELSQGETFLTLVTVCTRLSEPGFPCRKFLPLFLWLVPPCAFLSVSSLSSSSCSAFYGGDFMQISPCWSLLLLLLLLLLCSVGQAQLTCEQGRGVWVADAANTAFQQWDSHRKGREKGG